MARDKARFALVVAALTLWPLVYFIHAWWPGQPWSLAIGNDFGALYYAYKVYLLDMLAQGAMPLWSPMEGAGYAFFSSPFTQSLYPPNLLLAGYYEWRGGYTHFDHQFFAITGLSIYALGLYLWLREIEADRRAVFVAVLICTVSFKLTELLRFPNAVHTAAWMPWILWGVTLARYQRRYRTGLAVTCCASLLLLSAGYPYFAYYLVFLLPGYIAALLWRPRTFAGSTPVGSMRFVIGIGIAFVSALVVLMPYLLKLVLLTSATADRRGDDYQYSTSEPFGVMDTLGSLVYPPVASAEGWYFVSTLALVLMGAWLWHSRLRRQSGRIDVPVLSLLITAVVTSVITWGGDWYLFDLLWHYLPGFSSLRVWGRLNIILVPVLALLLARALAQAHVWLCERPQPGLGELAPLGLIAGIVLCVQVVLHLGQAPNSLWTTFFASAGPTSGFVLRSAAVLAAAAVLVVLIRTLRVRLSPVWLSALIALGCLIELYPVGSRQWMIAPTSNSTLRERADVPTRLAHAFETPRVRVYETLNYHQFNVGWVQNWYYARYLQFDRGLFVQAWERTGGYVLLSYGSELPMGTIVDARGVQAYREMMGLATGQRLFVTRSLQHASPQAYMADARASAAHAEMRVLRYDGDELVLDVRNTRPGYLSFIDNWDPDWRACVFGDEVAIVRPFGTFKAVALPPGAGVVRMRYSPWPFEMRAPCEP